MKKMSYLILIGEIIAICILHAIKDSHPSEVIPSAIDKMNKKPPVNVKRAAPSYIAFHQVIFR